MKERRLSVFIDAISNDQIQKALAYSSYGELLPVGEDDYQNITGHSVRLVREVSPEWLNPAGLIAAGEILNTNNFWKSLLVAQECEVVKGVRSNMSMGTNNIDDMAEKISLANRFFFGRTVALNFLAAALGEQFDIHVLNKFFTNYVYENVGRKSAIITSEMYQDPATSLDEVYERIGHLFMKNNNQRKTNLYTNIVSAGEFSGSHNVCPAPTIVESMFEEYGNLLKNPSFKQKFMKVISN